jgi:aryl-alcohol dehydrogenase-like predicted oxidoreductase
MSRLALGCYPLGGGYGSVSEDQARETVAAALDAGWTFLDTAETYLDSEERLGRILGNRRDAVFLATKVFPCEPYSAENLVAAAEAALRRLNTDRIDLLQLHGPEDWVIDDPPTPVDEIAEALDGLRKSGKALRFGACNVSVDFVAELHERVGLFSLQDLYGILDAGVDEDLPNMPSVSRKLDYAEDHGVRFLAYSPLARGLLSDDLARDRKFPLDDERHYLPRYQPGVYEHFADLAATLSAWAHEQGRTLRQLAVAWCLRNPVVASVLIGAKSPAQIAQIAGADGWVLTSDDMEFVAGAVAAMPRAAREALVTVWDHFSPASLDRLRERRHDVAVAGGADPES